MSVSSFPRADHVEAILTHALALAEKSGWVLEVRSSGLDRFRCQYRVTFSRTSNGAAEEVLVHFQLAEKLITGQGSEQLDRILSQGMQRCLHAGSLAAGAS